MSWAPICPDLQQSLLPGLLPTAAAALGDAEQLLALCEARRPDVLRVPLLEPDACRALSADLAAWEAWVAERGNPPNSMNRYGAVLAELGYGPALDELFLRVVRPLAERAFPEVGRGLESIHGFSVAYGDAQDHALGFHVDDADVTLNLCLGDAFTGSELYFRGRRCARHRQDDARAEERFEVEHEPGVAWLHAGAHRHGVHPIESGVRRNLILWCQSGRDRNDPTAPCPAWCGS